MRKILLSIFLVLANTYCGETRIIETGSDLSLVPKKPEPSYCSSVVAPGDPVTITGTAVYKKRTLGVGGLGAASANLPIRYAEVAIYNASGQVVQCGETDASGNFSISIERTALNVYVEVRSRALNSHVKASILNDHDNVFYYYIRSSSVAGNANQNVGTIVASHDGSLQGGAFHILDLIYQANAFLNTKSCTPAYAGCNAITVADKVTVFWKPGFNPATYLGYSASNTVSFYLSGTSRLYIVGGVNGDVDNSDTDHFDDIIVLHEYGHFIEDIYSGSDSPGGSHNGNAIIDPRLAWSEGWATYFATQIADYPFYQDTSGNIDGTTSNLIYYNIDKNFPIRDPQAAYAQTQGEGVFREFAVSRALLDATDADCVTCGTSDYDSDGVQIPFSEFWTIFAGNSGFKDSSLRFRSPAKFFSLHDNLAGRTDIKASILNGQYIYDAATADFFDHYTSDANSSGACADTNITPKNGNYKSEDGSFENSNQFSSNDFYEYAHPGGALNIVLDHDAVLDLDLYLYSSNYTFGDSGSIIASSDASGTGDESISTNISAGTYMINVKVYTSPFISSTASYALTINGSKVCIP